MWLSCHSGANNPLTFPRRPNPNANANANANPTHPMRAQEPFVELMKSSLNTFLNAFTYPDRTCYPVASTNSQVCMRVCDCVCVGGRLLWFVCHAS